MSKKSRKGNAKKSPSATVSGPANSAIVTGSATVVEKANENIDVTVSDAELERKKMKKKMKKLKKQRKQKLGEEMTMAAAEAAGSPSENEEPAPKRRKVDEVAVCSAVSTKVTEVTDVATTAPNSPCAEKERETATTEPSSISMSSPASSANSSPTASTTNTMNRQTTRRRTIFLNKKMAASAARKQESKVLEFFAEFQKERLEPTAHTYSILINCFVRLGNMEKAEEYWRILQTKGLDNIAALTAMLKGYWVEGGYEKGVGEKVRKVMGEFGKIVEGGGEKKECQVKKQVVTILPIRLLATFFRGCLRWGKLGDAKEFYEKGLASFCSQKLASSKSPFVPDSPLLLESASLEYLVQALCMGRSVECIHEAQAILQTQQKLWQSDEVKKLIRESASSDGNVDSAKDAGKGSQIGGKKGNSKGKKGKGKHGKKGHGKKGQNQGEEDEDEEINEEGFGGEDGVSDSTVRYEVTANTYIAIARALVVEYLNGNVDSRTVATMQAEIGLYLRLSDDKVKAEEKKMETRRERHGGKNFGGKNAGKGKGKNGNSNDSNLGGGMLNFLDHTTLESRRQIDALKAVWNASNTDEKIMEDKLQNPQTNFFYNAVESPPRCTDGFEPLLAKLSRTSKKSKPSPSRRVIFELGAGDGDWICSLAGASSKKLDSDKKDSTLWLANELRHDRCVKIWQQGVLNKLSSLQILGGDANMWLGEQSPEGNASEENSKSESLSLPDASVDLIVSNFPEPPAWHQDNLVEIAKSDNADSSTTNAEEDKKTTESSASDAALTTSAHLLTCEFVNDKIHSKLKPGGEFIVFSDNRRYCELVLRSLDMSKWQEHERAGFGTQTLNLSAGSKDDSTNNKVTKLPVVFEHPPNRRMGKKKNRQLGGDEQKSNIPTSNEKSFKLYRGQIPVEVFTGSSKSGDADNSSDVDTTSYFDRLWAQGKKKERVFFRIVKV